jgi:tRNA (mo5U34)-methyltransferase
MSPKSLKKPQSPEALDPEIAEAQEITALAPWFHNLHLPDGSQTCPDHSLGDFPNFKWQQIAPHLPEDLTGWSALDIGCNAGFYSFALARRGAHVLAIDSDPHYLRQARWAAVQFGLQDAVDFQQMQFTAWPASN